MIWAVIRKELDAQNCRLALLLDEENLDPGETSGQQPAAASATAGSYNVGTFVEIGEQS